MLNRGAVRTTLAALLGLALAGFLALKLGALLDAGWGGAWDRAILLAARGALPTPPLVAVTALGSGVVLTLIMVLAGGALIVAGRRAQAALLIAASVSGSVAVDAIKDAVARLRPEAALRLVEVDSPSFPSAHAANSAIVWLTLGAIAARLAATRALARYALAVAMALTLAIGASRVLLGVHWPSDVLAGWAFGAAWALGWWNAARPHFPAAVGKARPFA